MAEKITVVHENQTKNGFENEKNKSEQDFRLRVVFMPLINTLEILLPRRYSAPAEVC